MNFVSRRTVFFTFACLLVGGCLSVCPQPASAQSTAPIFRLNYAWGYTSLANVRGGIERWPVATVRLNPDHTMDGIGSTVRPGIGTWAMNGSTLTLTFSLSVYTGTLQTDGSYNGSMVNTNNWCGVWKGRFIQ